MGDIFETKVMADTAESISEKFYPLSRKLTSNEIHILKAIFKDSINYSQVRIHSEASIVQGYALSISGNVYFDPMDYSPDFTKEKDSWTRAWFIHEMTHVWQFQKNYNVLDIGKDLQLRKIMPSRHHHDPYAYDIEVPALYNRNTPNQVKALSQFWDFNMESQADIIRDYYAWFIDKHLDGMKRSGSYYLDPKKNPTATNINRFNQLKRVAEAFINAGKDEIWLPKVDFDPLMLTE